MTEFDQTEYAYKNGYEAGYKKGVKDSLDSLDRQLPRNIATIKANAIREFADELKKQQHKVNSSDWSGDYWDYRILVGDIDRTIKRMVGDE